MVQALLVKGPAQDVVWDEVRAKVEVEWGAHMLQGPVEIVRAQTVELRPLTLPDSRVIKEAVQSVVRK